MLGIMLNVNLTSCSKEDIVPDTEQGENNDGSEEGSEEGSKDEVVHPNGIPSNISNNIINFRGINSSPWTFERQIIFRNYFCFVKCVIFM